MAGRSTTARLGDWMSAGQIMPPASLTQSQAADPACAVRDHAAIHAQSLRVGGELGDDGFQPISVADAVIVGEDDDVGGRLADGDVARDRHAYRVGMNVAHAVVGNGCYRLARGVVGALVDDDRARSR